MTKSLTTLIANVQALLLDDGTRYTTATVTAAVRAALKEINQRAPVNQAVLIDAVTDQYDYEITETGVIQVNDILLWDADGDLHTPLPYDEYIEDARIWFRLRSPQTTGNFILARYAIPYTVSGLDSGVESTLAVFHDDILLDGSCFYCCQIRSIGRIETINLNQDVSENLIDAKRYWRMAFDHGLALLVRKKAPVSEPDLSAWNDKWHGWDV